MVTWPIHCLVENCISLFPLSHGNDVLASLWDVLQYLATLAADFTCGQVGSVKQAMQRACVWAREVVVRCTLCNLVSECTFMLVQVVSVV